MSREDQHFRLRIPADLKKQIEGAAEEESRSINAEIVGRLARSLAKDDRLDEATKNYRLELEMLRQTLQHALIETQRRELDLAKQLVTVTHQRDLYAQELNQARELKAANSDHLELPASLRKRINRRASETGRSEQEEIVLALEVAFPPASETDQLIEILERLFNNPNVTAVQQERGVGAAEDGLRQYLDYLLEERAAGRSEGARARLNEVFEKRPDGRTVRRK